MSTATSQPPPDEVEPAVLSNGSATLEPPRESTAAEIPASEEETKKPSKQPSKTQRSRPWTKLRDSVTLMLHTRQTRPYADHVLSATSATPSPPDESAVEGILSALLKGGNTADRSSAVGAVLALLRERLKHGSWQVRLKSLIVVHAICRGGNQRFVDYLAQEPKNSFDMDDFEDKGSGGELHSKIARGYAKYVKMWLRMRKEARFPHTSANDPQVTKRFRGEAADLLKGLPIVLDWMETLKEMEMTDDAMKSEVFKPGVLMMLHDMIITFSCLREGVERLVELFFGMAPEQAVPALGVYERVLKVDREVKQVVEKMRKIDERWKLPEGEWGEEVIEEMKKYIEGGCEHVEENKWDSIVIAATRADDASAREADIGRVLQLMQGGKSSAVMESLERRVKSADWRVVLKAMVIMRRMMSGARRETLEFLMYDGMGWLEGVTERVGQGVWTGLVQWFAEFLQVRVKVLYIAMGSGDQGVEKVIRALPRGLEVLDVLGRMFVHEELRHGVGSGVYDVIVQDVYKVFAAVVRKANDLVGGFFELEWELAEQGLRAYERFVEVVKQCDESGGVFQRCKFVKDEWRKPDEVVVTTDILMDMRMYVESNRPGSSSKAEKEELVF